jgi:hypothetical protein
MKMKSCLEAIQGQLDKLNEKYIDRKSRPMIPEDYDTHLKAIFINKI